MMPQRDGAHVAEPANREEGIQARDADTSALLAQSAVGTDVGSVAWRRMGVVSGILVALAGGAALLSAGAHNKLAVAASGLRDAVSGNRILGGEPGRKMCVPVHGKDVYGDELDVLFADDMDAWGCEWNCGERQDCGCWSYRPGKDNGCWLKKDPCGGFHDDEGSGDTTSGECSNCPYCSPQTRPKPWLVIPFYSRDLCKMKMTAASISKHDPHGYLGDVVLLWLDQKTPGAYQHEVDVIIGLIQSTHGVTFHDFSWAFKSGMKGWGIQQVMKLKASLLVHADFYVVLDAKNTFIRDVEHDTFITSCNTGVIYAEYTVEGQGEEKKGWFEQSAKALGVPVPSGKMGGSITPVVMHTQTVKDMLRHLSEEETILKLCSGKLCGYIDDGATEFTLYYTYARQLADEKCIHHTVPNHPALSLWRGIDGSARENAAKNAIERDDIIMFGSQPGVFDGLQGAQWYNIAVAVETIYGDVAGLHDKEHNSKESLMDCCCGGH